MTKKFILYSTPFILLFFGLSLFEPWLYQNVFASKKLRKIKNPEFEIIAHKGASGHAPENTMAAFKIALGMDVDMIAIDVRHTKDEEIVVFHDQFLDRVTRDSLGNQVTGDIHDYTLEELKQFEVGSWFDSKFKNEKIPTLKEVLDLVDGKCKVLVEIKHMDHPHYHDFSEKLIEVIREERNGFDWVILESYENTYLEEAHAYDDRIQTKKLIIGEDSTPLIAFYVETRVHLGRSEKEENFMALNPHYKTLSPRRIFRMHARGFKVYAYPVNERDEMIIMLNAGVDGIITDFPDRLMQIRKELHAQQQS
jgi:glycerophosphoryl diester phosphodiesterase